MSAMRAPSDAWKVRAERALRLIASQKPQLVVEDVWDVVGDDPDPEFDRRAMASVMKVARDEGVITGTGQWVKSRRHHGQTQIYSSNVCA